MNATVILKAAFPGSAIKSIARGAGCSLPQANRMVTTGKIPRQLRESVLRLVEDALSRRQAELRMIQNELREIEAEEMAARAAARRDPARAGNAVPVVAAEEAEQTTLPLVNP